MPYDVKIEGRKGKGEIWIWNLSFQVKFKLNQKGIIHHSILNEKERKRKKTSISNYKERII